MDLLKILHAHVDTSRMNHIWYTCMNPCGLVTWIFFLIFALVGVGDILAALKSKAACTSAVAFCLRLGSRFPLPCAYVPVRPFDVLPPLSVCAPLPAVPPRLRWSCEFPLAPPVVSGGDGRRRPRIVSVPRSRKRIDRNILFFFRMAISFLIACGSHRPYRMSVCYPRRFSRNPSMRNRCLFA